MLRNYGLTIVMGTLVMVMVMGCSKSSEPASDTKASAALPTTIDDGAGSMATTIPANPQPSGANSAPFIGNSNTSADAVKLTPDALSMGANPEANNDGGTGAELVGIVKSTIEVPDSKTMYVEIDSNGTTTWVASKSMEIKAGEKVRVPAGGLIMENFESKSLGRTFDRLVMTSDISKVE